VKLEITLIERCDVNIPKDNTVTNPSKISDNPNKIN
jgi:hypothetical protein